MNQTLEYVEPLFQTLSQAVLSKAERLPVESVDLDDIGAFSCLVKECEALQNAMQPVVEAEVCRWEYGWRCLMTTLGSPRASRSMPRSLVSFGHCSRRSCVYWTPVGSCPWRRHSTRWTVGYFKFNEQQQQSIYFFVRFYDVWPRCARTNDWLHFDILFAITVARPEVTPLNLARHFVPLLVGGFGDGDPLDGSCWLPCWKCVSGGGGEREGGR